MIFNTYTDIGAVLRNLPRSGSRFPFFLGVHECVATDDTGHSVKVVFSRRLNGEANVVSLATLLLFLNPLAHHTEALAVAKPYAKLLNVDVAALRPVALTWLVAWRRECLTRLNGDDQSSTNAFPWDCTTVRLPRLPAAVDREPLSDLTTVGRPRLNPTATTRSAASDIHEDLRLVRIGPQRFTGIACAGDPKDKRKAVKTMMASCREKTQRLLVFDPVLAPVRGRSIGARMASDNALNRLALRSQARRQRNASPPIR